MSPLTRILLFVFEPTTQVAFPKTLGQFIILDTVTVLATVAALTPPLIYLRRGWPTKEKQVMNDFDPQTVEFYFAKYWKNEPLSSKWGRFRFIRSLRKEDDPHVAADPATGTPAPRDKIVKISQLRASDPTESKQLIEEIKRLYENYFGRSLFTLPILMLSVAVFLSALFTVRSGLYYLQVAAGADFPPARPHILLDTTTLASIGGAYLWIVGNGIARMRGNDYLPSDIYGHILRMVIAIPLGWAFAAMTDGKGIGPTIAFAVGTFPLDTVTRFLRAFMAKQIGASDDVDTDGDEIKRLIGINNDVAHRLMAENVATVLALANCDPIRVMMRTNLDFEVVLDLMDQAIVAISLGVSDLKTANRMIDTMRASALARASQISKLMWLRGQGDANAVALVSKLPAMLQLDDAQVLNLLEEISRDDRTSFVTQLKANR